MANSFPNDRPAWDGKTKADQTWSAWKEFFEPLQRNLERETRVARGEDAFGTAAAAQAVHNVTAAAYRQAIPNLPDVGVAGTNLAEDFDAHFDNLATAATHGNDIVQGALSTITSTSALQHAEVKKLLFELKSAMLSGGGGGQNSGGGRNNDISSTDHQKFKRRISQLQAAAKGKWLPGNFCSTHGHGVGSDHDSKTCNGQANDHVITATRANPSCSGAN